MTTSDSPEHFLDLIKKSRRGRFKVYIGMIAGVGKTYRMLQEAHELLKAGVDVKIGFIEPHAREDVIAFTKGLPLVAGKKVFYKGHELEEMDLEEILRIHPEIVLVDELTHTNIPGSKNEKRWQDVLELLQAGINVISAFNVQHLDSMVNKIKDIAGIEVKETIPDKMLSYADEVVNIDLPAEDLIKRLEDGKIYPQTIFEVARENRTSNIVLGRPSFSLYRQLSGKNYFDKLLKKIAETHIDIILVF